MQLITTYEKTTKEEGEGGRVGGEREGEGERERELLVLQCWCGLLGYLESLCIGKDLLSQKNVKVFDILSQKGISHSLSHSLTRSQSFSFSVSLSF